MGVSAHEIRQLLFDYVEEIFNGSRLLTPDTRICGDLGLCDDDLWELIDIIFERISVPKPSGADPAVINVPQRDLTFAILADWIASYAAERGELR